MPKTIQDIDAELAAAGERLESGPLSEDSRAIFADSTARAQAQRAKLDAFFAPEAAPQVGLPSVPVLSDGRVPVKFRDGKTGTIDPKDAAQHIKLGGSFVDPAEYTAGRLQKSIDDAKKKRGESNIFDMVANNPITNPIGFGISQVAGTEAARSFDLGMARGATFGLSDAAILGLNVGDSHVPGLVEALHGKEAAARSRDYLKTLKAENPWSSGGGEVAGTVAMMLATSGLGAAGAGAAAGEAAVAEGTLAAMERKIAEMGAEYGMKAAMPRLGAAGGRILGSAVKNAPMNAAFGAAQEVSRAALDNDNLAAEHLAAGALQGLLYGAAADVGLGGLGEAWKAGRAAAKPLVSQLVKGGNKALEAANVESLAKVLGMADAAELKAMAKGVHGGEEAFIKEANRQISEGHLKLSNTLEQSVAGLRGEFAERGKFLNTFGRELDNAGVTVDASSVLKAAEQAAAGSPEAQAALAAIADRTGLTAERARVAEAVFGTLSSEHRAANPKLYDVLDGAKSRLSSLEYVANLVQHDKSLGSLGLSEVASDALITAAEHFPILGKQVKKLRAGTISPAAVNSQLSGLIKENKRVLALAESEMAPVMAGLRSEADAAARELADVPMKFTDARTVKNVIKEGGAWDTLPESVKKMWDGIEGALEGQLEEAAIASMGKAEYQAAKGAYQTSKILLKKMEEAAKNAKFKGSLGDRLKSAAMQGGTASGMAGMMGGPVVAGKAALGGAVTGAAGELLKGAIAERAPRAIAALTSNALEQEALAKLVANTDLTMQAILSGSGKAGKAAVLEAAEPKSRREQFKARVDMVDTYKANPDKFLKSIDSQLSGLSPGKRQALLMQVDKTMQYLSTKVPPSVAASTDTLMPNLKRPTRTSDTEMARFNESFLTAMDPTHAIKAILDGRYRKEHDETMKQLYPQLSERGQTILMANLSDAKKRPAPAARNAISKVMDMGPTVSQSPAFLARMRGTHGPLTPGGAAENRTSPSQFANRPQMTFQKNPTSRATNSQSTEMGER